MRSTARAMLFALLAGLALVVPSTAASAKPDPGPAPPAAADKIQSELERSLQADGRTDLWIRFTDEADLSQARRIEDWTARGAAVAAALRKAATASQAGVRQVLDTQGAEYEAFWATNAIFVHNGTSAMAEQVASRSEVEGLYEPVEYELVEPSPGAAQQRIDAIEWGVANINADNVWDQFGTKGAGITIANIDTGVQFDHPALVGQYRGNKGDGTFDHNYNWFDADGRCSGAPCDRGSHGTHTMGTMVGDDGAGNQIGVAPGATWIAANGCCPSDAALISSGQWMLEPTDLNKENPDASKRPHIINNSWGSEVPSTAPFMEDVLEAWDASGILGIWSNGNEGELGCGSSGSPGSRTISYSVGAYDIGNRIGVFSGRGAGQDGELKPNISAPGVNVRSSVPGNGYATANGTSMAAPHVSGAVALLWSAAPALVGDTDATKQLLDRSAIDTDDRQCGGTAADNNVYGEGRLDALKLLESAPVGDTGTLTGTVTDADTGKPVEGAKVTVGSEPARERTTGPDGGYSFRLTAGSYPVTVSAFGYDENAGQVTVTAGEATARDFALDPQPRMTLSGLVRDGSGHGWPLYAKVSVAGTDVSDFTNPFTGRYRLSLPADATYTLVVEPQYAGYGKVEQPVQVGGGNRTLDMTAEVTNCPTAPGYKFSAVIGVMGDDNRQIGDHLRSQGIPSAEVVWGDDISGYDVIVVNRPTDPGEEVFQRFLADTDAAEVGVLFLDTWVNQGGNGIRLLNRYLGNPGTVSSGIAYDSTTTLSYQVLQEHPIVAGFSPGDQIAFDHGSDSKHYAFFDGFGGEGRMVVANAARSDEGIVGVGIGVQEREHNRHALLSMHAASYASGPRVWHSDSARLFRNALDWLSPTDFACVKVDGGLVAGFVRDANTGDGLANAPVTGVDSPGVSTRTTDTPDDPELTNGFYATFSPAGGQRFTASAKAYAAQTRRADVAADWVTQRNVQLAAGRLEVTGAPVDVKVPLGGTTNASVTFTNTGGAPAKVELNERAGDFQILRADGTRVEGHDLLEAEGAPVRRIEVDTPIEKLAGSSPPMSFDANQAAPAVPAAEPWLTLPGLPRAVMDNSVVHVDGKVYSFGGAAGDSLADVYVYDPAIQSWSRVADMPYGGRGQAAEGVIDGKVYLVSGWSDVGTDTIVYDPATGGWSTAADVPAGSAAAGSAVLDGQLYVVGGCTTGNCAPYSDKVFRYDPRTDEWETLASYPVPIAFESCGAANGELYCAGGLSNGQPVTATFAYDPTSDSWTRQADMPANLWGSAYHTADDRLLISGGLTGLSTITNQGYVYDPVANSWSALPASNSMAFRPGSACGFYKVGGSAVAGFQPTTTVEVLPGLDQCTSVADTGWLTVSPRTATLAPGDSLKVTLSIVADVAQPGTYTTKVAVFENTPYVVESVPVTMNVDPPATWGKITGTVTAVGCDAGRTPLAGATVQLSTWTTELALYTDEDGTYAYWLDQRHNPVTMIVAKDGYMPQTRQTQITAGQVRIEDWSLRKVCASGG